jgi:hypothetical protein
MEKECLEFRFRWQRIAPDKDDFQGTAFDNKDLAARIYRSDDGGRTAWHWVVAVDGQEIGTGFASDPRAAAHGAEDAYAAATGPTLIAMRGPR